MLGLRVFACLPQPPVPLSHTDQSSQVRSWRPSPKDGWHRKHIIIWIDQDNDKKTKRHFDRRRTLSNRDIPRNQESWKRKHCIKEQTGRNSLAHKGIYSTYFLYCLGGTQVYFWTSSLVRASLLQGRIIWQIERSREDPDVCWLWNRGFVTPDLYISESTLRALNPPHSQFKD